MCGGRGTRLRSGAETERLCDVEKPLVDVGGEPMFDRVVDALRGSRIGEDGPVNTGTIHAVVSPNAPETAERARELSLSVVETAGDGYVTDLTAALDSVGRPAITVPADLPLLAPEHVDEAIERSLGAGERRTESPEPTSLTVCAPVVLKRRLGASVDTSFEHDGRAVAPTGLNVVAGDEDTVALTYDARLAINVNRPSDRELAEALCE